MSHHHKLINKGFANDAVVPESVQVVRLIEYFLPIWRCQFNINTDN